jgi:uncharacterized protein (DUF488 family)
MDIYTIGHSTRSLDEHISLLHENEVTLLADVRRYPGSRRLPHFSRESLEGSLPVAGIRYLHVPSLGGRRSPAPDSPNTAWRHEQFRAYADHMATAEFAEAIESLLADSARIAIMCAEAVPWRCHRNLIADELVRRGVTVRHILGAGSIRQHVMNSLAVESNGHLVYPAEQRSLLPLKSVDS